MNKNSELLEQIPGTEEGGGKNGISALATLFFFIFIFFQVCIRAENVLGDLLSCSDSFSCESI